MQHHWHMPVRVAFGDGVADQWPSALGSRRAVVMAMALAEELGWKARISEALQHRLIDWIPVPDDLSSIARCRDLAPRVWAALRQNRDAVLVALGGGTTLDVAKVLRCQPRASDDFALVQAALAGQSCWPELDLAELWMVPTTAGTGSEVTRWATVWDTDATPPVKRSFDEAFGFADRAFVDPVLTWSCPPSVTRDTALDALSHALEAIWNHHATPLTDDLALAAARRVITFLPLALQYPRHPHARTELSLAALEAGMAFSQTRTALAHALSYAMTLEQGVPHGLACAAWLPTAWDLACGKDPRTDRVLSQVFAVSGSELGPQGARLGLPRLRSWLASVGVVGDLAALGVQDGPRRVQAALESPRGRNFIGAGNG